MDVRCEKCQTEYELDEARLKPGGVTVKCTNCGHMFKIRKRTTTNAGVPAPAVTDAARSRPVSSKPPTDAKTVRTPVDELPTTRAPVTRADSVLGDTLVRPTDAGGDDRQWLIRLENGEQKSCKELATLQQWIVGGVVTRNALISRTGKTWKSLGDIGELQQYFLIADEARTVREDRSTRPTNKPAKEGPSTLLGMGASATGGTVLPDDDDMEGRSTGSFKARPKAVPEPVAKTSKAPATDNPALMQTELQTGRRPPTQPPPPPAAKKAPGPPVPPGRATAAWASSEVAATESMVAVPSGPAGGRLKASTDDPAFAGRVRFVPGDESSFNTGRVGALDDDDDVLPAQRGGRGGLLLVVLALLVMGAAGGAIYVFVINKNTTAEATKPPVDAAIALTPDAAVVTPPPPPPVDAPAAPVQTPVELAQEELGADNATKLRDALNSLEGNQVAGADAVRAHLTTAIAQGMLDRAGLAAPADKAEAEKLKKDAKALALEAGTLAQRALKAAPDDPGANLAMATVLRLQGKAAKDLKRYLDAAKAHITPAWKRDATLAEALALVRDAKLEDAKALLAPLEAGDDKLEASGDVRVRFRLAMITYAQNKPADAKLLVDTILAAAPDHLGAKALAAKLEATVSKTDPLPPEDPTNTANGGSGTGSAKPPGPGNGLGIGVGDSYDKLLSRANQLAEKSCTKALEVYAKALEQKPNGVEALTGMGYCHIDAKQFASAFSKFRAALAVSSRYEPALWGVGEAYMQQGRKDQAIDALKAYLEVYPGTSKAQKALDRLGAGGSTPDPNAGSGTPPTPTPTPTPTPEGAGSGSG